MFALGFLCCYILINIILTITIVIVEIRKISTLHKEHWFEILHKTPKMILLALPAVIEDWLKRF